MLPGWFDPAALATGLAFIGSFATLVAFGIWKWDRMMPGCRQFTVWGIAGSLALMMLVHAVEWIAQSVNSDLTSFTRSSQLFFSLNIAFVIFMVFAWDERSRDREPRS